MRRIREVPTPSRRINLKMSAADIAKCKKVDAIMCEKSGATVSMSYVIHHALNRVDPKTLASELAGGEK